MKMNDNTTIDKEIKLLGYARAIMHSIYTLIIKMSNLSY
jgi:hypothetical protein